MERKKRLYAPFVQKDGRWLRASSTITNGPLPAYTKERAVSVYQNWLLAPFLQGVQEKRELRPLKEHA